MRRPSPSLIVSVLALVVATGGTSYAAAQITSQDIKDDTVRSRDIKDGTIRSVDVKDGTLRPRDFRPGTLRSGPRGPAGPAGPQGEPGSASRWALIDADGQIEAQSGGFEVASAYDAPGAPLGAIGNVYLNANEDLSDKGIVVTLALQNQVDQNGDGVVNGRAPAADANPEFSGEVTASRCAIEGVVACAPTGTNTAEHLVVSPRLSDGRVTDADTRKRFYVVVTGGPSDLAPVS